MKPTIKVEIEKMRAEGNFFRKDVSKTVYQNMLDAVEWLTEQGKRDLQGRLPAGFTRDNIEGFTYRRTQIHTGASVQSRFGKVRLRPSAERPVTAGTDLQKYGPKRRPHITLWVYETGNYGGHRGADLSRSEARRKRRSRTTWVSGTAQQRTAHWAVKKTRQKMRAFERSIRKDMTEGLN